MHRTEYTPRIDTEKRSVIRENNLPIPKSIIREIREIRLIRDSEKAREQTQGYYKMNVNLKHKDITEKIIGAAFEVHKFLGNGFQEVVYQRALAIEMKKAGVEFVREIKQDIFYKDFPKPIGTRRADFVVAKEVVVELKAISALEDVHEAQILNYLKAYRLEIGLLLNFGAKSLEIKRLILTQPNHGFKGRQRQ